MSEDKPGRVLAEGFVPADFDRFLAEYFTPLVRAMALGLRRDKLAHEAMVHAMGAAKFRWRTLQRQAGAEVWVMRTALAWAGRRVRHGPSAHQPAAARTMPAGFDPSVDRALSRLDHQERAACVLRYYLDWSPREIGRAQRVPSFVARRRLRVALRELGSHAMAAPSEVAERLPGHLRSAAAVIDVAAPAVQVVRRRSRKLAVGLLIGGVAFFGVVALISTSGGGNSSASTVPDAAPPDTAPSLVQGEPPASTRPSAASRFLPLDPLPGPELVWERADLPADAEVEAVVSTDRGFVALQGYGGYLFGDTERPPRRVWTSPDGATWTEVLVDRRVFTEDDVALGVAAVGQRIVAAGVRAGPGLEPAVFVWDSDDGLNWGLTALGYDAADTEVGPVVRVPIDVSLAVTDRGVLLWARTVPIVDRAAVSELLPEQLRGNDFSYGFNGIWLEVTGPRGIVAGRLPLAELGIGREAVAGMFEPPRSFVWHSTDGRSWQPATVPAGVESAPFLADIASSGEAFYLVAFAEQRPTVWRSRDGADWIEVDLRDFPGSGFSSEEMAGWGDGRTVISMFGTGRPSVWIDFESGEWARVAVDPPGADDLTDSEFGAVHGGGLGIVLTRTSVDFGDAFEPGMTIIEKDGLRLEVDREGNRIRLQEIASGEILASVPASAPGEHDGIPVDVAARTFSIVDEETGETLFTATWDEWVDAGRSSPFEFGDDAGSFDTRLWFSMDGTGWSRQSLLYVVGSGAAPVAAAVGESTVVMVMPVQGSGGPINPIGQGPTVLWFGRLPGN